MPTPINSADTTVTNPVTGIVTIDPGNSITKDVQYYRYNNDPTVYQNSLFGAGAAPTTQTAPAVTSDPYRSILDKMYADIQKPYTPPMVTYNGEQMTNQEMMDQRRAALDQRRKDEVTRLTNEFNAASESQAQAQKGETGTSSMGLARIGGFDSASGQAVLTNLARVHEQEKQALIAKRENAISLANQAFEDKDFELAQMQLTEAKDAEKLIYDRTKDFLNLTLDYKNNQRADLEFQFQKEQAQKTETRAAVDFAMKYGITDPFYLVGGVGYDTRTGESVSYDEYIARGGKPDFSNAFVVDPNSGAMKEWVKTMMNTYGDAGILPTDDAATVQAKLQKSRLYQKDTYIAPSDSGAKAELAAIKNTAINEVLDTWGNGMIQGNSTVSSKDYRIAKEQWMKKFGADSAKEFDDQFVGYVDRTGPRWQQDYGITNQTGVETTEVKREDLDKNTVRIYYSNGTTKDFQK